MQGTKNPRERGKFSSNTVRLTVCWAGDIVADSEKGRLNFLFADLLDQRRVFDAGDDAHRPAAHRAGLDVDAEHALGERCAQVIAARRSAGVLGSVWAAAWPDAPLPRPAWVTCARCALFGANTPW